MAFYIIYRLVMKDFTIKNRKGRTSLANFERDLIKQGLLTLGGKPKEEFKEKKLKDFIINFLKTYNRIRYLFNGKGYDINLSYNTWNIDGSIQTTTGKRRSGGDIFRICKTYFPKCTFIQVMQILSSLDKINPKGGGSFRSSICSEVHKRVYRFDQYNNVGYHYKPERKDEFNKRIEDYIKLDNKLVKNK